MSLGLSLVILGLILWFLFNPTIGIIFLVVGVVLLLAGGASWRGGRPWGW